MKRLTCVVLTLSISMLFWGCSKKEENISEGVRKASIDNAAPQFTLSDITGKQVSLSDYRGKVVLLEFFTSWCYPCQTIAPALQDVYRKYAGRDFIVIGISLKEGFVLASLKSFVEKYKISYPTLIDDGNVSRNYAVFSIPTSFVIDRTGKVRNKHMGSIEDFSMIVSKEIDALL
ncbi:MAG: peroxiredoxin family protein [Dissulfurispiraceae bacterium]